MISRRGALSGLTLGFAPMIPAWAGRMKSFGFEAVIHRARALASRPYAAPTRIDAPELSRWGYDQYFDVRPIPEIGLWPSTLQAFRGEPLHVGFRYMTPVRLNLVEDGQARPLEYRPGYFDYSRSKFKPAAGEDYGFSGFRLLADGRLHEQDGEFVVFQGASYFRAIGKSMAYGLSARGLAIASGRAEEFPLFREFWIVRPDAGEKRSVTVYALLDSKSIAGAYRFVIEPGARTRMDVEATLFPRADIVHAGIAPLTSMYLFGPSQDRRFLDYRSSVHDSDLLLVWERDGKRISRPLVNPGANRISEFSTLDPVGFGLLQRERDFTLFQDLEANYHRRPSCWVTPGREWGPGAIELVELHSGAEWGDNIVACWRPDGGLRAGAEHRFSYRLDWFSDRIEHGRLAAVAMTRVSETGGNPHFIVEFETAQGPVAGEPVAIASPGGVAHLVGQANPYNGRFRVSLVLDPRGSGRSRLQLWLTADGRRVSEVWLYDWSAG